MLQTKSPGEIKAVLAELDMVVTGRMHAAILAMGGGTPAYCFAYQGKLEGLFSLFGLEQSGGLLHAPEELVADPSRVARQVTQLLGQHESFRRQIEERLPSVIDLAEKNFA